MTALIGLDAWLTAERAPSPEDEPPTDADELSAYLDAKYDEVAKLTAAGRTDEADNLLDWIAESGLEERLADLIEREEDDAERYAALKMRRR